MFKNKLARFTPRPTSCGVSLYRGVLIEWNSTFDTRACDFLDAIPERLRHRLLSIYLSGGVLRLVWSGRIPREAARIARFQIGLESLEVLHRAIEETLPHCSAAVPIEDFLKAMDGPN